MPDEILEDYAMKVTRDPVSGKPVQHTITTLTGSYAQEYFQGSSTKTHTFNNSMRGFVIRNKHTSSLYVVVGAQQFPVAAGDVFTEMVFPFKQITIVASGPYEGYCLGDEKPLPALIASDTFERADNSSSLGVAETGQSYIIGVTAATWGVSGGKAIQNVTAGLSTVAVIDAYAFDVEVECDVLMPSGAGPSNYGGLCLRYMDNNSHIFVRGDSRTSIRVYSKNSGGSYDTVSVLPFTFSDGQVVKIKAKTIGKDIEIFANGVSIGVATLSETQYDRTKHGTKHGMFAKSPLITFDNLTIKLAE
ncbi:hypothetical protein [Paenibacillus sp.]|uniref:hypothetical protein n=1 Tax=Paenibacillus sp. TaxID=58172 RepID=UPI002D5E00BB|nr:hypothetical protein [Paenibacillus sp.]HZG83822.1 hypothetical protein [Paenibacillus sp.]